MQAITTKIGKIKMTLHIFNPEHDLALAADMATFTAPHAARLLRYDMGFLPALLAGNGDAVLVENKDWAEREYAKACTMAKRLGCEIRKDVLFVEPTDINSLTICKISPWGWDTALTRKLALMGIDSQLLPSAEKLNRIREWSNRKTATLLLKKLRKTEGTQGEAFICNSLEEAEALLEKHSNIVIKAPWSSSGRGLRFGLGELTDHQRGWTRNMIAKQGNVVVEPYYKKVKDFGMEFYAQGDGTVAYQGLSLFNTHNGAYIGNMIATETMKEDIMARYAAPELLEDIRRGICTQLPELIGDYEGPVGIDMMVLANKQVHPCVEINLRRTMGHVALSLLPSADDMTGVMRIEMINNNYKLKLRQE